MFVSAAFYQLYFRAHSLKSLERNILGFAGISPVRHSVIGSVDSSRARRDAWLQTMRELGAKGE